jgi:transposase InsO family protein
MSWTTACPDHAHSPTTIATAFLPHSPHAAVRSGWHVDSFKTELISDRIWQTRSQLELAIVEYLGWFNTSRLHQALGDLAPAEYEAMIPSRSETITDTEPMVETT